MRQSTLVFAVLLFAFVVYITERGQIGAYLALFKRKDLKAATIQSKDSGGGDPLSSLTSLFGGGSGGSSSDAQTAQEALQVAAMFI